MFNLNQLTSIKLHMELKWRLWYEICAKELLRHYFGCISNRLLQKIAFMHTNGYYKIKIKFIGK
jgi:hypothetical protein